MIAPLAFFGPTRGEDPTCYTSPVQHVTYSWPSQMGAFASAFYLFACVFLAITVVWMWKHYRPCPSCGEYQAQCRCRPPEYDR